MIPGFLVCPGDAWASRLFEPSLRDYVHTAWTQHDGVPLSAIRSITQTTDGYLWITTTEEGLLRFDGVRFVSEPSPCGRPANVTDALSDRAGGLYLLCAYRLFHRDSSGRTVPVKQSLLPPTLRPSMNYFIDQRRRLWLWGKSLRYLRPDGSEGPEIPGTERPREARYCEFAEDSSGNIWFATARGLVRIRDDQAERVLTGFVLAVGRALSGGIYAVRSNSIDHIRAGPVATVATISRQRNQSSGRLIAETTAGIWFGTRDQGLSRIRDGNIEFFSTQDGLSSRDVNCLFVDSEGSIWVGTQIGLHRFREPLAYLMSNADGVPFGMPFFVFEDSRNGLWLGTTVKTVRIDRDSGRKQILDSRYWCIGEDRAGKVWVATESDLGYLQGSHFVAVRDSSGARVPGVRAIHNDDQGGIWVLSPATGLYKLIDSRPVLQMRLPGSSRFLVSDNKDIWVESNDRKLLHIVNGARKELSAEAGLTGGRINVIQKSGDSIWVGGDKGLARWRNGKWTTWTVKQGLPGTGSIFEIATGADGRLWLMSYGGILVVNRHQLETTRDGQPEDLAYLRIGSLDRVSPHTGGIASSPRATRDAGGRLFFATYDSFAVVDPLRTNQQSFSPPIVLETVLVNRRPVTPGTSSRFVEPEDVQFEYTSLSLRNPENVRFRYRLEGRDNDWTEAGSQRRVTYGALKPGSYRFQVIGSGSEGVWNNTGASYDFRITLPFYKTYPFLLAVALTIATFIWLFYRYRMQLATERVRLRIEAQADERIRIAQEMHDSLLQGIHSVSLTVFAAQQKMDHVPSESRQLLDRALEILGDSTDHARRMLSSLRAVSSTREPLPARLEALAEREAALYPEPPHVLVEASGSVRDLLDAIDRDVYLIASEALKNAFRHSQARHITVSVQFETADFQLTIADDGVGISPETRESGLEGHFGLGGMRERAARHSGAVKIECPESGGTRVHLSLPGQRSYATSQITRSGNAG
jgi:signal transduction histidine kinase/ligand-binding sensor domain-containing protein